MISILVYWRFGNFLNIVRRAWLTVSKAFDSSKYITSVGILLSVLLVQSCNWESSAVVMDGLKRCWLLCRVCVPSLCLILFNMTSRQGGKTSDSTSSWIYSQDSTIRFVSLFCRQYTHKQWKDVGLVKCRR